MKSRGKEPLKNTFLDELLNIFDSCKLHHVGLFKKKRIQILITNLKNEIIRLFESAENISDSKITKLPTMALSLERMLDLFSPLFSKNICTIEMQLPIKILIKLGMEFENIRRLKSESMPGVNHLEVILMKMMQLTVVQLLPQDKLIYAWLLEFSKIEMNYRALNVELLLKERLPDNDPLLLREKYNDCVYAQAVTKHIKNMLIYAVNNEVSEGLQADSPLYQIGLHRRIFTARYFDILTLIRLNIEIEHKLLKQLHSEFCEFRNKTMSVINDLNEKINQYSREVEFSTLKMKYLDKLKGMAVDSTYSEAAMLELNKELRLSIEKLKEDLIQSYREYLKCHEYIYENEQSISLSPEKRLFLLEVFKDKLNKELKNYFSGMDTYQEISVLPEQMQALQDRVLYLMDEVVVLVKQKEILAMPLMDRESMVNKKMDKEAMSNKKLAHENNLLKLKRLALKSCSDFSNKQEKEFILDAHVFMLAEDGISENKLKLNAYKK